MFNPHTQVHQVTDTFEGLAYGLAGVVATALADAREDRLTDAANALVLRDATARLRAARLANARLDASLATATQAAARRAAAHEADRRDALRRARLRAA